MAQTLETAEGIYMHDGKTCRYGRRVVRTGWARLYFGPNDTPLDICPGCLRTKGLVAP